VNARDKNRGTPPHTAAQYNENPEVMIILLAASTDGNAVNDEGETSFDLAKE
jgi:ankyrin repeat protein